MELCTCSKCSILSFTDINGQQITGHMISRRNQHKHQIQDLTFQQSEISEPSDTKLSEDSDDLSSLSNSNLDFSNQAKSNLPSWVCIFLVWLHPCCGVSQRNYQLAQTFLLKIMNIMGNQIANKIPKEIKTTSQNLVIQPVYCTNQFAVPLLSHCTTFWNHPQNVPIRKHLELDCVQKACSRHILNFDQQLN